MTSPAPRIGIAGVHGHGASHVRAALDLERKGRARLVALADHRLPAADRPGVRTHGEALEMIEQTDLDIVVLSTPMHTHLPLALAALEAGAHVLLEKPPTPTLDDFRRLVSAADHAGRAVQLGFQSLGSAAVPAVRELVAEGAIGRPLRFGALATWVRTEQYWRRTRWAGRRTLDGVPVVDGAVTNPLAHAVATGLALAGATTESDVAAVRLDLYRANDIEADDTSSLIVEVTDGPRLACALSLTAGRRSEPCVIVEGTAGRIALWYTLDVVQVTSPGSAIPTTSVHPRTELLENLVDHIVDGVPLLVPAPSTGAFMRVLEAVRTAPDPVRIERRHITRRGVGDDAHLVVDGLEEWSERVVAEGRTFAELGAPWAVAR